MALNVHKDDFNKIKLPADAISEDRGLRNCGTPYLVVADTEDASYWKNDRTGIAYKFDSMLIELEDVEGNVIAAPGIAVSFPYQSDARGFVIDWRQVVSGGQLAQGCYRVIVNWELGGNSGAFYYGSFNLLSYSFFNVQKTVRLFVVLNDLVRKQGINYKDSGFGTTIRFKGQFGYMQPNYDTENIVYTNRTREKVRNEALRTYELRSNYLLSCQTRMIDEEYLLTANQIYVTDHNANNHVQSYFDFPVILSEDESPSFEYNEGIYAKVSASFKEKVAVSESKYDGNISGSANIILELPTVVTTTPSCADATVENSNASYTDSVVSGGTLVLPDITVTDSDGSTFTQPSVEDVVCTLSPDTSLEVNGTPEGTFAAGSTIEVNITDGVNPVTPDAVTVVGDVVTIEVPAGSTIDADAQAFLTATAITDVTITGAIDTLVKDLKTNNLWLKFRAIYPFVGGTATTHKFNLKDPQDTDEAFRLTFSGGITHSATGADPNGTNGFADTHLRAVTIGVVDVHLSVYSREDTHGGGDDIDIGTVTGAVNRLWLSAGLTNTNSPTSGLGGTLAATTGAADGFFINSLTGSSTINNTNTLYKNGSSIASSTSTLQVTNANTLHLFGANGIAALSNRELAFASIGFSLTSGQAATFNTIVQAFQTTLSRNV